MSTVSMYYLCSLSLTRPTTAVSIFPGHTSMRFGPRSWSGSGSGLSAEEKNVEYIMKGTQWQNVEYIMKGTQWQNVTCHQKDYNNLWNECQILAT